MPEEVIKAGPVQTIGRYRAHSPDEGKHEEVLQQSLHASVVELLDSQFLIQLGPQEMFEEPHEGDRQAGILRACGPLTP